MQRVEMLKIAECTQLIDPAEVVVSQGVVLSAEPVLTPIGGYSVPPPDALLCPAPCVPARNVRTDPT